MKRLRTSAPESVCLACVQAHPGSGYEGADVIACGEWLEEPVRRWFAELGWSVEEAPAREPAPMPEAWTWRIAGETRKVER